MPLIYDYLSAAGDAKWYLPPQWYAAQLTNTPGFTTTAPEAVIRKATMLEGPPPPPAPSPAMAAVAAPAPHAENQACRGAPRSNGEVGHAPTAWGFSQGLVHRRALP